MNFLSTVSLFLNAKMSRNLIICGITFCSVFVVLIRGQSHLTPQDFEAAKEINFKELQKEYLAKNKSIELMDPKQDLEIGNKAVRSSNNDFSIKKNPDFITISGVGNLARRQNSVRNQRRFFSHG